MGRPIYYVAIVCDRCKRTETGDVEASSQPEAEDGLRARLVEEKGWRTDADGDFCARCLSALAEAPPALPEAPPTPPAEDSDESPPPRLTGPPEVEALHAIDQLIGNRLHLGPTILGQVRRIVLDALNDWHQRQTAPAVPDRPWDYLPGGGMVTYPADGNPDLWR